MTAHEREAAIRILMNAVYAVEAAQHRPSVVAAAAAGVIDQSAINEAKDAIAREVRKLER